MRRAYALSGGGEGSRTPVSASLYATANGSYRFCVTGRSRDSPTYHGIPTGIARQQHSREQGLGCAKMLSGRWSTDAGFETLYGPLQRDQLNYDLTELDSECAKALRDNGRGRGEIKCVAGMYAKTKLREFAEWKLRFQYHVIVLSAF